jgi:hypothetical protein
MASRITSITGLQNLTGLVNLYADWNSLTSINLSGLTNLVLADIGDQNTITANINCLKSVNLAGCTALQELYIDDSDFSAGIPNLSELTDLVWFNADQSNISGSIDLSGLPSLQGFNLSGNSGVTSVTISSSQLLGDGWSVTLDSCSLTQTAVDNILVALAANSINNGYVSITGVNNASPSVVGINAIIALSDKGWTVDYNVPATTVYTVSTLPTVGRDCDLGNSTSLFALESDPANVTRFYTNGGLTDLYLGDDTSFYSYAASASPLIIYTANISSTTGVLSDKLICS